MASKTGSSNSNKVDTGNTLDRTEVLAIVVDDIFLIRKLHKDLLDKHGFKTYTAENGKEAVELCQTGEDFDLIIMDFRMPVMDGVEATKKLRDMGVYCLILAVTTAYDDAIVKKRLKEAGVDYIFPKPLSAANLAKALNNL